ncbi:unnamed protein product [Protopolystoma xenopodis]|uniref:Uncharacterized protein n=1 Tax=Protopolystoma xenopodis TaxID=117903 RepID=A0A448WQT3_9PLAT|nr:unnamed protein product [Protopolystoma xenopodis]
MKNCSNDSDMLKEHGSHFGDGEVDGSSAKEMICSACSRSAEQLSAEDIRIHSLSSISFVHIYASIISFMFVDMPDLMPIEDQTFFLPTNKECTYETSFVDNREIMVFYL